MTAGAPSGRARAAFGVLAAALLSSCGTPRPEPPRFTNLVLIVIDTLRSDHLASYGYDRPTAPFLDRLAEEGIRLQGMAASSWTKPSVATLLTGVYPQRHGANTRADKLPASVPFLPEILQGRGFSTVGYTANWFTGPSFGFDRGFDTFLEVWPPEPLREQMYRNPASPDKPHATWATDSALELARSLQPPFFLSVHYLDPHDPYTPAAAWGEETAAADGFVQPAELDPRATNEGQTRQLIDQYDAVIREVDDEIARLFEGLRRAGLLEETLWVVTSDHGEEFLDHGNLTHGKTLFEEVLRVPLLFWSSSGLEPQTVGTRFHHVDFLPTVLQALGLEVPEVLDGVGRWSAVSVGAPPQFEESLHHLDLDATAALAMSSPPWKLIHQKRAGAREGEASATNLLFHLDSDPAERVHREDHSAIRESLLRELISRHNGFPGPMEPVESVHFDETMRRDLAGLGYLDTSTPQDDLERRNIPDRLRFHDARTWGLFAGGTESGLVESVSAGRNKLAQQVSRLPVGSDGAGPADALHWALRRPEDATRVMLDGDIARAANPATCQLAIDGVPTIIELEGGPFDQSIPLPASPGGRGVVYLDLSCGESPDAGSRLRDLTQLRVRVGPSDAQ
jgi:arylsulfatase A-like enzyme